MTRHFVRLDVTWARFVTVLEESIDMRYISGNLGRVEEKVSSQTMSAEEINQNIEQAVRHGFREVSEAEFLETQAEFRAALANRVVESLDPNARAVAWDVLAAQYRAYLHNDPAEYLGPNLQTFCVYDAPCQMPSDLLIKFDSLAPTVQSANRNLIFNQGLEIDGNFDAGECSTELPQLVIVKGDLHVKNLILTGWVEVVVTGDAYVSGTVLAVDGEAGGRLHVHGNLTSPQVLGGMMYPIQVDGQVTGNVYWLDFDEPSLANASIVPGELTSDQGREFERHSPVVREAYAVDSNWATGQEVQTFNFAVDLARDLVRAGQPLIG